MSMDLLKNPVYRYPKVPLRDPGLKGLHLLLLKSSVPEFCAPKTPYSKRYTPWSKSYKKHHYGFHNCGFHRYVYYVCILPLCIPLLGKKSANEVANDGVETDEDDNEDGEDNKLPLLATSS